MGDISFDLKNKVVLVTGGSKGIGYQIAKLLLEQKAKVIICGRKQENLDKAVSTLNSKKNLMAIEAHIAREEYVDNLFQQIMDEHGRIDAIVNNVGMNLITSLVDAEIPMWNKIIETNLTGTFLCSRKAAQIMRDQKVGKIVSVSSLAGRKSAPLMGIYGIAKAGMEMMTKVFAHELAPFNVQVNAVAPGMVRTDFSRPFWSNEAFHNEIVKAIPSGRIAEPRDVAHSVLFFCSKASDYITGQTLLIDGGASVI